MSSESELVSLSFNIDRETFKEINKLKKDMKSASRSYTIRVLLSEALEARRKRK